jgi:DNA polymerase III subunit epsilon
LGFEIPDVPRLCTMLLYRWVGPALETHKLSRVCEACGVSLDASHCAIADARATSQVLAHLLRDAEDFEIRDLSDLRQFGLAGDAEWMCRRIETPLACGCAPLNRQQAGHSARLCQRDFIQELVERLRPTSETEVGDGTVGLYLNLLDRVLEDRRIDSQEREELVTLAAEWGLSCRDAERGHQEYLGMLIGTALADGLITGAEMGDLKSVADLLAVPHDVLEQMIASGGHQADVFLGTGSDRDHVRECTTVCFTGETPGPGGQPITREEASALAESKGLIVAKSVTKKLDLLVVADPDSQSSKARKARDYGVRVMAAPVFWRELGLL